MSSQISNQNIFIPWATCQNIYIIPSKRTNSSWMTFVSMDEALLDTIPELYLSWMRSDGKNVSCGIEISSCNHILISDINQSDNFRVTSVPQVYRVAQSHGK